MSEPSIVAAPKRERTLLDYALVAGVAVALLAFYLLRYLMRDFGFPMGPDAPVYLWWARLAAEDGLSAVSRPGVPALTLVLGGTLGISQTLVLAALGGVFGAIAGLAGAVFASAGEGPKRWLFVVGGLLTGTFAAHLAGGYFANLVFAALFLAAAALLASTDASIAAAALFGAGGLAHPLFFVVGLVILVLTALASRRRGTSILEGDSGKVLVTAVGGGVLVGAGLAALFRGPDPPDVPTSKDGYLRRAGLEAELRAAYLERFAQHWLRFVPFVSLPLAIASLWKRGGFVVRFLRVWGLVAVAGVAGALITGRGPAERFITFAYVLPIGATLGLAWLWRILRPRPLAIAATVVLVAAMIGGAVFTWAQQHPFFDAPEAEKALVRSFDEGKPGTPILVAADAPGDAAGFEAARVGNLYRSAVASDRIRDVHVYIGSQKGLAKREPTFTGDSVHDALSRLTLAEIKRAAGVEPSGTKNTSPPAFSEGGDSEDFAPQQPLIAGVAILVFLIVAGFGWAWVSTGGPSADALALSPAFGAAGLILVGIAAERLGLKLTGAGPAMVSGAVAVSGYLLAFLRGKEPPKWVPFRKSKPAPRIYR
ncbi:MAG: hypothetical protein WD757_01560 [Actinomycetota bacterium]